MIVYGRNVIKELLENNKIIEKIYISDHFNDQNLILDIQKRNIELHFKPKKEIDRLANENNQGIIAFIPEFQYSLIDEIITKENPLILILDHLEDMHNFGSIIRSALAFNVDGIIIPKDRSVSVNATVFKTSSGAINNMKIVLVNNLVDTIKYLKKKGFWIYATDMNGVNYKHENYNIPIALIIGNEAKGISRLAKENADIIISIPINNKINSLNASVAAGIIINEIVNSRKEG